MEVYRIQYPFMCFCVLFFKFIKKSFWGHVNLLYGSNNLVLAVHLAHQAKLQGNIKHKTK